VYGIEGNRQVLIDEVGTERVVGENSSNLRGRHEDYLRTVPGEPAIGLCLVAQVELCTTSGQDRAIFVGKTANDCIPNHSTMAGHKDTFSSERKRSL
jgi:hypothetical protein